MADGRKKYQKVAAQVDGLVAAMPDRVVEGMKQHALREVNIQAQTLILGLRSLGFTDQDINSAFLEAFDAAEFYPSGQVQTPEQVPEAVS